MGTDIMQLRDYTQDDQEEIASWYLLHGKTPYPFAWLPKLGIICEVDSVPVGAAWLGMDNSVGVANIPQICVKPGLHATASRRVMRFMIDFLEKSAKELGYGVVFASLNVAPIKHYMKSKGYKPFYEQITVFAKGLT